MRDGGVAQLGEHLLCKQGVVGSNPIVSTIPDKGVLRWLVWMYRGEEFRYWCRWSDFWVGLMVPLALPGMGVLFVLFFIMVNQVLVRLWALPFAFV